MSPLVWHELYWALYHCIARVCCCSGAFLTGVVLTQRRDMSLADIHKLAEAADSMPTSAIPIASHIAGVSFLSAFPAKGKCTNIVLR